MSEPFAYIWEYKVRIDSDTTFRKHYGPGGTWVQLFRKSPGYISTQLFCDLRQRDRYVTVDRWESIDHFRKFRTQFSKQYEELSRRCRELTVSDAHLGTFDLVGEALRDPSFPRKRRRSD